MRRNRRRGGGGSCLLACYQAVEFRTNLLNDDDITGIDVVDFCGPQNDTLYRDRRQDVAPEIERN